jgi:EAL domain-containing protein (putative c-di-GMP-specific phosphodiesterase class I)
MKIAFFSPQALDGLRERYSLEHDLRYALARNELLLHYQPVIDTHKKKVVGAEALIRWQHPVRGLVSPNLFIPLAEAHGMIDEIGRWTLRTACRQIRLWHDSGEALKIAVNISAHQFNDISLIDYIRATLRETGIEPGRLEIELTETAAMADAGYSQQIFTQLRDLGITVAIDDFGTGYSSLSYLTKLPFDRLKIDREFVHRVACNRAHLAICKALIALAQSLNLEILAEGAETFQDVQKLIEQGCHTFQGFYFSKPLTSEDFIAALMRIRSGDNRVVQLLNPLPAIMAN